jgi:biotin carboxylase
MTRELLLVGVGQMGQPYIAAARRLGLDVRAVEVAARSGAIAGKLDAVWPSRGDLDEQWAEAAYAAVADRRPDGIVAFSEPQVLAAALVQDALGLPGPSLHAAVLSRNKALQRGRFAAAGIRQPTYKITGRLAAAEEWAASRLPVVVKPLASSGSAGVELVRDLESYQAVAVQRGEEGPLLVETAVNGPEYSWEALIHEGTVWYANTTAKETTGPPYFVEVAHRTGVQLEQPAAARVEALGAAVLVALGMRTGLVHLEFRLARSRPVVMEVAVRTPGGYLMDLLSLTYGFDWFEIVVRLAMSLPLAEPPPGPSGYAASYFPVAPAGLVVEASGLEAVCAHPRVVRAGLSVTAGDILPVIRSSAQRTGYVVLAGDTQDEVRDALEFVRRTLAVRTRAIPADKPGEEQVPAREGRDHVNGQ